MGWPIVILGKSGTVNSVSHKVSWDAIGASRGGDKYVSSSNERLSSLSPASIESVLSTVIQHAKY